MKKLSLFLLILFVLACLRSWHRYQDAVARTCSEGFSQEKRALPESFQGVLSKDQAGKWALEDVHWKKGDREGDFPFSLGLHLSEEVGSRFFGRGVRIYGRLHCTYPLRNPAHVSDGLLFFSLPRITVSGEKNPLFLISTSGFSVAKLDAVFETGLQKIFGQFPKLLSFERLVWAGDTEDLPQEFKTIYKEGGLLHLLALNGQRVAVLIFVFGMLGRVVFCRLARVTRYRFWFCGYRYFRRLLPVLCCLILYITGHGGASLLRVLAMALACLVLSLRRLHVGTFQLILSSVVLLSLANPALLSRPGFFLSVVAATLFFRLELKHYLWISLALPVLIYPLSAFFFAKVSWVAPLTQIALGWLWTLFILPAGFLLPLAAVLLPSFFRTPFLGFAQKIWEGFCASHSFFGGFTAAGYETVLRPNLGELFIIEFCLLTIALNVLRRYFSRGVEIRSIR